MFVTGIRTVSFLIDLKLLYLTTYLAHFIWLHVPTSWPTLSNSGQVTKFNALIQSKLSQRTPVLCRTFQLVAKDILYAPSHKQRSPYDGFCYTSCGALAETRNGCMRRDHSTDPSHIYGARCSSVVRAFAHGVMGQRIDPSWWTLDWFNKGCGILSVG